MAVCSRGTWGLTIKQLLTVCLCSYRALLIKIKIPHGGGKRRSKQGRTEADEMRPVYDNRTMAYTPWNSIRATNSSSEGAETRRLCRATSCARGQWP